MKQIILCLLTTFSLAGLFSNDVNGDQFLVMNDIHLSKDFKEANNTKFPELG
jgi:hypothetical protein